MVNKYPNFIYRYEKIFPITFYTMLDYFSKYKDVYAFNDYEKKQCVVALIEDLVNTNEAWEHINLTKLKNFRQFGALFDEDGDFDSDEFNQALMDVAYLIKHPENKYEKECGDIFVKFFWSNFYDDLERAYEKVDDYWFFKKREDEYEYQDTNSYEYYIGAY